MREVTPVDSALRHPRFAEMCSGSEAGSQLRLIDLVRHSTLGLRVMKKKKTTRDSAISWVSDEFHLETLIIYKLRTRKFTTHNDLY